MDFKKEFDLIIVGGGAAGMMAAITAAREKKSVLLLEKLSQNWLKTKGYRRRTLQPDKHSDKRGVYEQIWT